ncbi:MAG: DALR domain-containing protein, partial [Methylophilaceae bacterium]
HDCTFVNYWMHNGFVRVDDEKMSKSLGNFFTIREVLKKYDAEVVRFFILRAHYRSPLNYSDQHLDDAKQALSRLYTALRGMEVASNTDAVDVDWQQPQAAKFKAALDDDFNTPEAFAVLFELANEVNKTGAQEAVVLLRSLAGLLGLLERDAETFLQGDVSADGYTPDKIEQMIAQRLEARRNKNFAEADRVRQELMENGVVLEDSNQGTIWRRL